MYAEVFFISAQSIMLLMGQTRFQFECYRTAPSKSQLQLLLEHVCFLARLYLIKYLELPI